MAGKTENLFVYGMLGQADIQKNIFGRKIPGTPDILPGYKRSTIKVENGIYPLIVRAADGNDLGGVVLKISRAELASADAHETRAYKRTRVVLKSGKAAWVYLQR